MDPSRRPVSAGESARPPLSVSRTLSRLSARQSRPQSPLDPARTPYYDASTGQQSARRPPPPIQIRRLPSTPLLDAAASSQRQAAEGQTTGRRRSTSMPLRPQSMPVRPQRTAQADDSRRQRVSAPLAPLTEETSNSAPNRTEQADTLAVPETTRARRASDAASNAAEYVLGRKRRSTSTSRPIPESADYEADVVDLLDVIDPEVSTLNTLNNVQNSLFIPNLGRFFNRQPTYDLSPSQPPPLSRIPTVDETGELELKEAGSAEGEASLGPSIFGAPLSHSHSISSVLSDSHYAVLPHGVVLEGWSEEDKAELNDHVRHLLHSRKAGFKRSMRAFGKYVRTPLGAFVTIYAFLITFWGAAWVLFIIGWLSVHGRQAYFIEICDQVLTALFCLVGIGMSPFRTVDTYHMIYIAKYHYKTLRLRRERALPDLPDPNDLPEPTKKDEESGLPLEGQDELLLSPEEQAKFEHHRAKFCKSHTFYKPHETFTHKAFGIDLLVVVVTLLDFHSLFQMALGGTTWGINYHHRPKALTAVILSCSISCNISAGLVISIGGKKTRKKDVVERLFRQALTEEALHKMEKKGLKSTTQEAALADVVKSTHHEQERAAYESHKLEQSATIGGMLRP